MWFFICVVFVLQSFDIVTSIDLSEINVPPTHLKYIFNSFEDVAKSCLDDPQCPKELVSEKACWGYERNCHKDNSYPVRPICPGDHRGWVKTKQAQLDTFYSQADFGEGPIHFIYMHFYYMHIFFQYTVIFSGYVQEQIEELMVMCDAAYPTDTSLECSKYLR